MAQSQNIASHESIYRKNFVFFLLDGVLFSVALGMIGATTVIPDFVRQLTDSEIIIGLSSSIFSIGYTLPQLFIARLIMNQERKKWWFIVPNIPTRFVLLLFGAILWTQTDMQPEVILLFFLLAYAIAALGDGLVGVSWADLTGSSLNEPWRARFYGLTSAGSGLIMLAITPLIAYILGGSGLDFPRNYALIFTISGGLFVISILPVIFVHELTDNTPTQSPPPLREYMRKLVALMKQNAAYRRIIASQVLTSLYLMAMPFYIGFGTTRLGISSETAVPTLLAMQTIGNIAGALLYTWIGARNNTLYIRLALAGGALLPITALIALFTGPESLYVGFLLSGAAISNLMFGYQNWIITHAPPKERPIYIGLSNTFIAVITLGTPVLGGIIVQTISYELLFVVALTMVIATQFVLPRTRDVRDE